MGVRRAKGDAMRGLRTEVFPSLSHDKAYTLLVCDLQDQMVAWLTSRLYICHEGGYICQQAGWDLYQGRNVTLCTPSLTVLPPPSFTNDVTLYTRHGENRRALDREYKTSSVSGN